MYGPLEYYWSKYVIPVGNSKSEFRDDIYITVLSLRFVTLYATAT